MHFRNMGFVEVSLEGRSSGMDSGFVKHSLFDQAAFDQMMIFFCSGLGKPSRPHKLLMILQPSTTTARKQH